MNTPSTYCPTTANSWFLTGPTASGKTAVGLVLAKQLDAEIISLDSMAVYRSMDIGTAKPTLEERRVIPHHLIDILDPDQDFSLAQYVAAAQRAVEEIASRGRVPLFVGGTPLYLKSLLRGIFSGPPADWPLRQRLRAIAESEGVGVLHAKLALIDPKTANRLHPQDERRVIRALEVWESMGRSITDLQLQFDKARAAAECRVYVLDRPREELIERIDSRVDRMFAAGLVEETCGLLDRGRSLSRTSSQAVGYREVVEHLNGARNLQDTIGLAKIRTRQFAKRQMTWFRSLSECRMVPISGSMNPAEIASRIVDN